MNRATISILSILLLFIFSACNQNNNASTNTNAEPTQTKTKETQAHTIEITDAEGNTLTFDHAPESIATLDSGVLDILQQLDANITGRPSTNAPLDPKLETIEELGNPHQPNFEMIAKVNPDVFIVPLSFKRYESNMRDLGIPLFYTKANSIQDIQETGKGRRRIKSVHF